MPPTTDISELLEAIAKAGTAQPEPHEACPAGGWVACDHLARASEVEQSVPFRQQVDLLTVPSSIGDPIEGQDVLRLGCGPLSSLAVTLGLDLRYEQQWHLTKQTLDEVEEATSSESGFVDRDVLNVARSSSRTRNWSVSGNAALTLPKVSIGANASLSSSVTESASSSAENVTESTNKAAESLILLHKVEVTEVSEFETTNRVTRKIENPYRDRSLHLRVFDLQKGFCVHFVADSLQPVIVLDIGLNFDRAFVLRNGDFLVKRLMDRFLQSELVRALEDVERIGGPEVTQRAGDMARLALRYLFDEMTIFNVPEIPMSGGGTVDGTLITESFDARHFPGSGLEDAHDNKLAIVFTTLNLFHTLYTTDGPLSDRDAIELTSALAQAIAPVWNPAAETDEISDVLDVRQPTEIFRRVGGFLTLVAGTLDPLLAEVAEEADARRARRRAEFVIDRVVAHLRCYAKHYTAAYLGYLGDATDGVVLRCFVQEVLDEAVTVSAADRALLVALFASASAYLDGPTIVVPTGTTFDRERSDALVEMLDPQGSDHLFGRRNVMRTAHVVVPTDGMHIEPVTGTCVLDDVPAAATPAAMDVRIVSGQDGAPTT